MISWFPCANPARRITAYSPNDKLNIPMSQFTKPMTFVKATVTANPPVDQAQKPPKAQPPADIPPLPYKIPEWSQEPDEEYWFEILKNGSSVETSKFKKNIITFGRLPTPICDISLEVYVG